MKKLTTKLCRPILKVGDRGLAIEQEQWFLFRCLLKVSVPFRNVVNYVLTGLFHFRLSLYQKGSIGTEKKKGL